MKRAGLLVLIDLRLGRELLLLQTFAEKPSLKNVQAPGNRPHIPKFILYISVTIVAKIMVFKALGGEKVSTLLQLGDQRNSWPICHCGLTRNGGKYASDKIPGSRYVPGLVWKAYLVLHNGSGRFLSAMFTTNNSSLCADCMSNDQQGHAHQGEAVTHLTVNVTAGHIPGSVLHISILGVVWKMFKLNSCSNSSFFSLVHCCLSLLI